MTNNDDAVGAVVAQPIDWQINLVQNAAKRLSRAACDLAEGAEAVTAAARAIAEALSAGNKVLVAGNGGSAASAQHFSAEFTGKLAVERDPLPAIALTVDSSALTAIANDWSYADVFARQVHAYGQPGDVFVGLSTSGSSENVKRAVLAAQAHGMTTIVLTGSTNGLGGDYAIMTSVSETARVQEVHDLILHELIQICERIVFQTLSCDASADCFPFVLGSGQVSAFRDWVTATAQRLVTTNGVFDLLHEGHLSSLRQARAFGDQLVVLVNADESVRKLKGDSRPIQNEDTRLRQLCRSGIADHAVLMESSAPMDLLRELRPDVHCKGEEYAIRPLPEREIVEHHGGRIELLVLEPGLSTSALVARMRDS